MMTQRVLLTGAGGKIGSQIRRRLAGQYDWVLTDKNALDGSQEHPFYQADITDLVALRPLCQGIDVVVHCAATSQITANWQELLPNNVIGASNILQAAVAAHCRRVVFCSSYHVVYGYPADQPVRADWPIYPVNSYGVSKVWGERLASFVAQQHGLSVICLRLGAVKTADELNPTQSNLAEVITYDDLVRLLVAAIESPDQIRFGCFHGLSNNRRKRLDICETEQVLGYIPMMMRLPLRWTINGHGIDGAGVSNKKQEDL